MTPIGLLEKWAKTTSAVPKRTIPAEDSIYGEAQKKFKILKNYGIAPVLNVSGTQIGADKLGHFFDEGYTLYLLNYKTQTDSEKYRNGLRHSIDGENQEFGAITTGVFSYADVSANYGGQKFWEKVCGNANKDTRPEDLEFMRTNRCKKDAYVLCDNKTGDWILNPHENFTLKDYVTPAWDESINCSLYEPEIVSGVYKAMNLNAFSYQGNPRQPCPAEPQKCIDFQSQYPAHAAKLLTSPVCKKIIEAAKTKNAIPPEQIFNYSLDQSAPPVETPTLNVPNTKSKN